MSCSGTSKTASPAALTGQLHDHLPGADDLARLGADGRDRARDIGDRVV